MNILPQIFARLHITAAESVILQVVAAAGNVWGQNAKLSYEVLSARTGFSKQWVIKLVHRLEAKNLLRVVRTRLSRCYNDINRYSVVRPWVRELDIREVLKRKQEARAARTSAQMGGGKQSVYPEPQPERNPPLPPVSLPTEADVIRLGRDPTTPFGKLLMGLADT